MPSKPHLYILMDSGRIDDLICNKDIDITVIDYDTYDVKHLDQPEKNDWEDILYVSPPSFAAGDPALLSDRSVNASDEFSSFDEDVTSKWKLLLERKKEIGTYYP